MKSVGFKGKKREYGFAGWAEWSVACNPSTSLERDNASAGCTRPTLLCRMGRRAGFCLNSLLAQREEKMAAEVGGEPEFEILVFLILSLQPPWRMVKRER